MKIIVNKTRHEFKEEKLSITKILEKLNYTFPIIVVKHNDIVVQRPDFDSYFVTDGDDITIMHIFAGG